MTILYCLFNHKAMSSASYKQDVCIALFIIKYAPTENCLHSTSWTWILSMLMDSHSRQRAHP